MGSADGEEAMQGPGGGREGERILVSVRVRPLNEKEASRNEVVDWECVSGTTVVYKNHLSPERSMYPTSYTFDRVFRCDCSTRQVYEDGAKAVVLSAVSGINSSVFAYGQTSSGKTYTMSGITEYTMEDIFDYIQKHKEREFHMKFSAMEIYNESVRDLLTADNSPLRLLDDPERGTVVEKLREETLRDWSHFKELLAVCEAQRKIGETFLNEASSRSHQILRLTIESSTREFLGKNNSGSLAATLNFVDLAGSERASQALSAGSRLKEGSHINRSLLTLGTVIRKLSKGRTGHFPYRDSKLTRILQSSLGGNARTAIICTMSPARSYVEQSRNTLLFASCAKEVTTNAHVNVVMSDKALLKHLQRELDRLESELKNASPTVRADTTDLLREKDFKIEELERRVNELTLQLDLALSQIHNLQQAVEDRSPSIKEGEISSYPRLHVRQASESSVSDTTTVTEHSSFDANSPVFESSQSPDRHSRVSYDENYSISDFDENLPPSSPFERMFIETPSDTSSTQSTQKVDNDLHRIPQREQRTHISEDVFSVSKEIGEQSANSCVINPHQAFQETGDQTPDTFEIRLHRNSYRTSAQSPYFVEFDPYQVLDGTDEQTPNSSVIQYQISGGVGDESPEYDLIDPHQNSEAIREQNDDHLEDYCKEVQCIDSRMTANIRATSLPPEEGQTLLSTSHGSDECRSDKVNPENELNNTNPSPAQNLKEPLCTQQLEDAVEAENSNSVESRRSRSLDISNTASSFPENLKYESAVGSDEFNFRLGDGEGKISDPNNEVSQNSSGKNECDEIPLADIKVSNQSDTTCISCVAETKEITESQCVEHPSDCEDQVVKQEADKSMKIMKDVGLNPQDDLDISPLWAADVKRLQREIIFLWDACNMSLVHRTHFFLLFIKGDQTDTIYLEVERRRLSFIKDAFSLGNSIVVDGWKLTNASSERALHSERGMLARLMKKRLSGQERINLYVKWGISLDTKRRSSQLAHRLWISTSDMDHIVESASVVAKLVRFSEPQVPKEVFGLNLMANQGRRKSNRWK